jgi:hypothetical protein
VDPQGGDTYYLSYATGFTEKIAYSTAPDITGPWKAQGLLAEVADNRDTIHQSIIIFKGKDYSLLSQRLHATSQRRRRPPQLRLHRLPPPRANGRMKRVLQTTEGVSDLE